MGMDTDTLYDVFLERSYPGTAFNKIAAIKAVRTLFPMGLKAAKDVVDNAPSRLATNVTLETVNNIRKVFEAEASGAEINITPVQYWVPLAELRPQPVEESKPMSFEDKLFLRNHLRGAVIPYAPSNVANRLAAIVTQLTTELQKEIA